MNHTIFGALVTVATLFTSSARSAACCGGGAAFPSLIAGDERAQVSTQLTQSRVAVDYVNEKGEWYQGSSGASVQSFVFEAAHLISDRWQLGFSLPLQQRNIQGQVFSGLGDSRFSFAYEYLPDWNFNPYRPKGLGYIFVRAPFGRSIYSSKQGGMDSFGTGLWALGLGSLLTKTWFTWDAFVNLEFHRGMEGSFANQDSQVLVKPGWGGQFSLGAGKSISAFRLGGSLTWVYEDPIHNFEVLKSSPSSLRHRVVSMERYATAALVVGYLIQDSWSASLTYADQTLFGSPTNTSLSQSLGLQLQRRWQR